MVGSGGGRRPDVRYLNVSDIVKFVFGRLQVNSFEKLDWVASMKVIDMVDVQQVHDYNGDGCSVEYNNCCANSK